MFFWRKKGFYLENSVRIQNETGTICGHISYLPINGCVDIITIYGNGESEHQVRQVYVDDLDSLSQNIVYNLVRCARRYHERN